MKEKHELSRGRIATLEPFTKFPKGISILHQFATNVKLLTTLRDAIILLQNDKPDDPKSKLMPLLVLSRHPLANKTGTRPTPLHVALEKQSPVSFETMMELLVD